MSLLEAIKPYREPEYGLVGLVPNPPKHSTDNALLFHATLISLLTPEEREIEKPVFEAAVLACEFVPGRYGRYPGDTENDAWDNLVGIAYASYVLDLPFAADIYQYGHTTGWVWNNADPGKWTGASYLGRYPTFIPFLKTAAKAGGLNPFAQMMVSGGYLSNWFEEKAATSGRLLLRLQAECLCHHGPISDAGIHVWKKRMKQLYPGGYRELMGIYFGQDHPFTQYAPSEIT